MSAEVQIVKICLYGVQLPVDKPELLTYIINQKNNP